MCGRFASYKNFKNLKNIFSLNTKDTNILSSYNVSPGQQANIVLNYNHENYLLPSNWGFSFFNNNSQKTQIIINSRVETINSSFYLEILF